MFKVELELHLGYSWQKVTSFRGTPFWAAIRLRVAIGAMVWQQFGGNGSSLQQRVLTL